MDRLLRFLSLSFAVILGGCTAMMESSTYGSSDLYITNNREMVAEELTARAEAERAEAEMRRAMLESYNSADNLNYTSIVADDYESAYARRLYGFNSPTYRLPSSYYSLATSEAIRYASAYDPAFYNIMVSGDQVWVEPKYVTSMFGTWGATNVTFGIYSSPWVYGWGGYYPPSHYTMWGYPHYSWYDWNWNMCYNPYHWGYYGYYAGCYPHYHGHYHPHYPHHPSYPPHYNPAKPGVGDRYHTAERRNSASRYGLPGSTSRVNGRTTTTVRGSGATSSGINNSRVNRGSSSSGSRSSSVSRSTTTSGSSSSRSGSSSSGRSYRSSSTSVGSSVSSSSSSISRSSSSSISRSSSSSISRSSSSTSRSSGSSSSGRSSSSTSRR